MREKLSGSFLLTTPLAKLSDPLYVLLPYSGKLRQRDFSRVLKFIEKVDLSGERYQVSTGDVRSLTSRVMTAVSSSMASPSQGKDPLELFSFREVPGTSIIVPTPKDLQRGDNPGETLAREILGLFTWNKTFVFTYSSPRWNDNEGVALELPYIGTAASNDQEIGRFALWTSNGKRNFQFSRVTGIASVRIDSMKSLKGFAWLKLSTQGTHAVTWEITSEAPQELHARVRNISFMAASDKTESAMKSNRETEELEKLKRKADDARTAYEKALSAYERKLKELRRGSE